MDWWVLSPVNGEDAWWDYADDKVLSLGMRRSRCCSILRKTGSNCRGRGPNVEWKSFASVNLWEKERRVGVVRQVERK
jgi:hypothetical protein